MSAENTESVPLSTEPIPVPSADAPSTSNSKSEEVQKAKADDLEPNVEKTNKYGLNESQSASLKTFKEKLSEIIEATEYDELFGYQLTSTGSYYDDEITNLLLIKLLKSANYDIDISTETLTRILKWRKEFNPLYAAFGEDHGSYYDPSGFITLNPEGEANLKVVTWNFYGNVEDTADYFADLDKFLRWRVGLMEKAMQLLDFKDPENDLMVQIHDYAGVSIFKMNPNARKASKSVIEIFGKYYPELLYKKYFVNVPSIMAWLYTGFKTFVPENTKKRLDMLRDSKDLNALISKGSKNFSKTYGGEFDGDIKDLKYDFKREQMTPYTAYLIAQREANTDEVD